MIICLKVCAKQTKSQHAQIQITERLPYHIQSGCTFECDYSVKDFDQYYLLSLKVTGILSINCLRCLDVFPFDYENLLELAICSNEKLADELMHRYETIVSTDATIDLTCLITDELHLYTPEKHLNLEDCNYEKT